MSPGILAFLAGLYVVPLVLLWWGHGLRRRSHRHQRAFWGAITGHCIAGVLALAVGMLFPESWSEGELVRGFLGLWALLLFPLVGALAGAASATSPRN